MQYIFNSQVDIPNSVHAFQTAERIREVHPDKLWFHLTGLIHDIGKIMAVWGEPQVSYCLTVWNKSCYNKSILSILYTHKYIEPTLCGSIVFQILA